MDLCQNGRTRQLSVIFLVFVVRPLSSWPSSFFNLFKDECDLRLHNCHPNADCVNRDEGFDCICSDGYTGDGVIECVDIHECLARIHDWRESKFIPKISDILKFLEKIGQSCTATLVAIFSKKPVEIFLWKILAKFNKF